jgi:DNA mismatch repair protein MutL
MGVSLQTTYPDSAGLSRIAKIPDLLINQIAAGEVVERPASALKELLENSIDAHSRRIEVWLKDGGMSELTVVDDGAGIHPEDLTLCLERHATSKIRESAELESIATYGFRGEALASIASVAEVELKSRPRGFEKGVALSVHYGVAQSEPRPVGSPPGTSITVKGLFHRLPARQKFLRSASTEFSHCARIVKELAVGNPQVAFSLHHQGRLISKYTAPLRKERIFEAFEWDWVPLHIEEEAPGLALDAYLTPGDKTQNRGECLLFVNQRPVKNRGLLSAVRQAYLSTLGPHHEPSGVIYLDIRKDWVDVNVHPQKTEVRCLKQETLYGWIVSAIRKAIAQQPTARPISSFVTPSGIATDSASRLPDMAPVLATPQQERREPSAFTQTTVQAPAFSPTPSPRPTQSSFFSSEVSLPEASRVATPLSTYQPGPSTARPLGWKYLGQSKAAYLICEDASGLLVVDQHALHEKLRFEELVEAHEKSTVRSQRLLVPRIFRPPVELAPLMEETLSALAELGYELEPFGDGDWAIKALPERIPEVSCEQVILESLREVLKQRKKPSDVTMSAVKPLLATIACHSVVRAGQAMTPLEAEALLRRVPEIEMGWTCPHGRPVAFRLSFSDIEKHFERK